jgi:hypothetical protein
MPGRDPCRQVFSAEPPQQQHDAGAAYAAPKAPTYRWHAYSAESSRELDLAFLSCSRPGSRRTVDMSASRYVDVVLMQQVDRDDPCNPREVRGSSYMQGFKRERLDLSLMDVNPVDANTKVDDARWSCENRAKIQKHAW